MTSYNTYPPIPWDLETLVPEGPSTPPQVGSKEQGPRGTYHLKVVQTMRQGLIAKEEMFKKKYKKYNKILNRLMWLNACSSGLSIAT